VSCGGGTKTRLEFCYANAAPTSGKCPSAIHLNLIESCNTQACQGTLISIVQPVDGTLFSPNNQVTVSWQGGPPDSILAISLRDFFRRLTNHIEYLQ